MKRILSYILLLLFSLAWLTSSANSEGDLLDFLDRSAEEMRIQVLKNEELVSQGRASEGVYFYDLRYQYNGVETLTADKAIELNQTFATYNNKVIFILMPLLAESETGKSAAIATMQMYVMRVANKLDPNGVHSVIGLSTVLGFTGDMYSFPTQIDGANADQAVANITKSALENVTCRQEVCYINAIKRVEGIEGNGMEYMTYSELSQYLTNGKLFFIAPSGKLFAVDMTALYNQYSSQNPKFAFEFYQCENVAELYGLRNLIVKLNNQNWNIKNYIFQFNKADNIFITHDDVTYPSINVVYPDLNPQVNRFPYFKQANAIDMTFGYISDIDNYYLLYNGSIKGESCIRPIVISPPGSSGSGTSSTVNAGLNSRARAVNISLTTTEINTINQFLDNHTSLKVVVTSSNDVSNEATLIVPDENTVWINREQDTSWPDGYSYTYKTQPVGIKTSWDRLVSLWSADYVGESDVPDFDNFFSDIQKSTGYFAYTLSQWDVAASELSRRIDDIRIPESVWNAEHPDYSPWAKWLYFKVHKLSFTTFSQQNGAQTQSIFIPFGGGPNELWASFCGYVNGVLDIFQAIPDAALFAGGVKKGVVNVIKSVVTGEPSDLETKIIELQKQYHNLESYVNFDNPGHSGVKWFFIDAIDRWVSKQNSTTIAHHQARIAINILVIVMSGGSKAVQSTGTTFGQIFRILSRFDEVADIFSPIGYIIKSCRWVTRGGKTVLSTVYKYGNYCWLKLEGDLVYFLWSENSIGREVLKAIDSELFHLCKSAGGELIPAGYLSEGRNVWIKRENKWGTIVPKQTSDALDGVVSGTVNALDDFLVILQSNYNRLYLKIIDPNLAWGSVVKTDFMNAFGNDASKLNELSEASDLQQLLSKWKETGETNIARLRNLYLLDPIVIRFTESLKDTYILLIQKGLLPSVKGNTILLKSSRNEIVAMIYNNKLTPVKWKASYKSSSTIIETSEGYWLLKEGDEFFFDLGFKDGRILRADEVDDYLVHGQGKDLDGQPYWASTKVDEIVLGKKDEIIYFVEDFNSGIAKPGQYASKYPISTLKELREVLAVKEAWKNTSNQPTLRMYRVKKDLQVRSGIIGRQSDKGVELPGGGHQYEIVDYLGDNWNNYLEEIDTKGGIKLQ